MTHDDKRYGTTTLFAAMDAAPGRVISLCQQRHRHQEWLKFLRLIDEATPQGKQIHFIADSYATHNYGMDRGLVVRSQVDVGWVVKLALGMV
jgi:hypothetical protein